MELLEENSLKDVACVVFFPTMQRDNPSIYLIDITRGKLRGFLHLDPLNLPWGMAFVVYKSRLYMFGGNDLDNPNIKDDLIGCPDAFVLNLCELANPTGCGSDNKLKPVPKRITSMKAGKSNGVAVVIQGKICVFDFLLGHKPPDTSFEILDPDLNTWHTVQDPFLLEPGHFVDGYCVKDSKLFVSIRCKSGVYELNINGDASPFWIHHRAFHGVKFLPIFGRGVQMGSLLFVSGRAYDLAHKEGFTPRRKISVRRFGETADKGYEVCEKLKWSTIKFGDDKMCSIQPMLLCKPGHAADLKHGRTSMSTVITLRRPFSQFPVIRKCRRKKFRSRFVVSVCSVARENRRVSLNVLRSFMVPMDYDGEEIAGCTCLASLCDT